MTVAICHNRLAQKAQSWLCAWILAFVAASIALLNGPQAADAQAANAPASRGPTVASLDGCADQYVLGLVPRERILSLSDRARLQDSSFRDRAVGLRRLKPSLEGILSLHPDAVIRTWGGDIALIKALTAHGIKVIQINEVSNYDQARDELYRVAGLLDEPAGAAMEAHRLAAALKGVIRFGQGRTALYYTPSGFTVGPDTMVGDMLKRLGFRLESQDKGEHYLSPEVLLRLQPDVFALGFYDDVYAMRRVPGRQPLVRAMIERKPHFTLPRQAVACSGWFTAYDLQALSEQEAAKLSQKASR